MTALTAISSPKRSVTEIQPSTRSMVTKIVTLVLQQLSTTKERQNSRIERLKNQMHDNSYQSAGLLSEAGGVDFKWSLAGMAISVCLSVIGKDELDKMVAKVASEIFPKGGQMSVYDLQARMKILDQDNSVKNQDYQAISTQSQGDSTTKQDFLAVLQKMHESLQRIADAR